MTDNSGWVSVGIDHDTAEFTVESIRKWWCKMEKEKYEKSDKLQFTADGGGSNGRRNRFWKKQLQDLSNQMNMELHVYFPPATGK